MKLLEKGAKSWIVTSSHLSVGDRIDVEGYEAEYYDMTLRSTLSEASIRTAIVLLGIAWTHFPALRHLS